LCGIVTPPGDRYFALMSSAGTPGVRPFEFAQDTFAFAHQLVWEYRMDADGRMNTIRANPPPTYYHRCFVMVRAARQFFYHARFNPDSPLAQVETVRRLVRAVVSRNPRRRSVAPSCVVIPGSDSLRSFSQQWESLLKAECGAAWESYVLRSHWRMVFPVSRWHQAREARRLEQSIAAGGIPAVHLFCFPRITINHGILLFSASATDGEVRFKGYDPNIPAHPVELRYRQADQTFYFPANHYWAGGKLQVVEIYRNWIY